MQKAHVVAIVKDLNEAGVRYLVAGGLAVVAHGHTRFTADIDLIVALDSENLLKAIKALKNLGYRPRVPVEAEQFADPVQREAWIREKGMVVFSMASPAAKETVVDLFVEIPFDFDEEYSKASWREVGGGIKAPIVSLERLIEMKRTAGRGKDLLDIEALEKLGRNRNAGAE